VRGTETRGFPRSVVRLRGYRTYRLEKAGKEGERKGDSPETQTTPVYLEPSMGMKCNVKGREQTKGDLGVHQKITKTDMPKLKEPPASGRQVVQENATDEPGGREGKEGGPELWGTGKHMNRWGWKQHSLTKH